MKIGAPSRFSEAHVLWVLYEISKKEPSGRNRISKLTGLGSGSVRTIFERLKKRKLIRSSNGGTRLTESGAAYIEDLNRKVSLKFLKLKEFEKNKAHFCIFVQKPNGRVKTGMIQRDAAVGVGLSGATTLVYNKGVLEMPGFGESVDFAHEFPESNREILESFQFKDGSVLIIGSEESETKAKEAAWVASYTLLDV